MKNKGTKYNSTQCYQGYDTSKEYWTNHKW